MATASTRSEPTTTAFKIALREVLVWAQTEQKDFATRAGIGYDKFRRDLKDNRFDPGDLAGILHHLRSLKPGTGKRTAPALWQAVQETTFAIDAGTANKWVRDHGFVVKPRKSQAPRTHSGLNGLPGIFATMTLGTAKLRRAGADVQGAVEGIYKAMDVADAMILLLCEQTPIEWTGSGTRVLIDDIAGALNRGAWIVYVFPSQRQINTAIDSAAIRSAMTHKAISVEFDFFKLQLARFGLQSDAMSRLLLVFDDPKPDGSGKNDERSLPFFVPGHKFALLCRGSDPGAAWSTGTYPIEDQREMVLPLSKIFTERLLRFCQRAVQHRWENQLRDSQAKSTLESILLGQWKAEQK